jgi:hypothetical protein
MKRFLGFVFFFFLACNIQAQKASASISITFTDILCVKFVDHCKEDKEEKKEEKEEKNQKEEKKEKEEKNQKEEKKEKEEKDEKEGKEEKANASKIKPEKKSIYLLHPETSQVRQLDSQNNKMEIFLQELQAASKIQGSDFFAIANSKNTELLADLSKKTKSSIPLVVYQIDPR